MDHYTLTRWVNFIFFGNFPARGIPAVVHLLASLQLAVYTTAASYLATTSVTPLKFHGSRLKKGINAPKKETSRCRTL